DFGSGKLDTLGPEEIRSREIPLFAVDVIGYAAQSIGFKNNKVSWLASIDLTAHAHLEFCQVLNGNRGVYRGKKWQLRKLKQLIQESELSL
ncbi:MAG: hypothetical protein KDA84_22530, partial [Planctomycetaceae bacterium]|nr:hypothetical protein [Planctomycetaceae bacterium]